MPNPNAKGLYMQADIHETLCIELFISSKYVRVYSI